jgi:hypothetical protein
MVPAEFEPVASPSWLVDDLRKPGYSEGIATALDCVTKRQGESHEQFVERAASDPIARQLKLADLEDNMDVRRPWGRLRLRGVQIGDQLLPVGDQLLNVRHHRVHSGGLGPRVCPCPPVGALAGKTNGHSRRRPTCRASRWMAPMPPLATARSRGCCGRKASAGADRSRSGWPDVFRSVACVGPASGV